MVSALSCDLEGNPLNFVYKKRSDFNQAVGLGKMIQKLEADIPGGILIFFPSYDAMNFMITTWDHQQVKFNRDVFSEERGGKEFEVVFKRYLKRV